MLLIAVAGGFLYLEATGRLEAILSGGAGIDLSMNPVPSGQGAAPTNGAGNPPLESMAPLDADTPQPSAGNPSKPAVQPTQWPALSPAELLARLKPDPALALTDRGFDLPPWQRLSRPAELARGQTAAAALVTGLGLNKAVSAAAIAELPPEISLSFSPYAADLGQWIAAARALGHEALVDLPMEPASTSDDPGPLGLMTGLNTAENTRRIVAVTTAGAGAFGIASAQGGKFLRDETALQPVMQEFSRLGLAFIETGADPQSQGPAGAAAAKTPYFKAGLQIDAVVSRAEIERQLGVAIKLAHRQGRTLIVAGPYPISIAALSAFVKSLPEQGIVLVPASALIQP
jgi:polysaccharide deacetylase 2 family uncharacterized protein YibQ